MGSRSCVGFLLPEHHDGIQALRGVRGQGRDGGLGPWEIGYCRIRAVVNTNPSSAPNMALTLMIMGPYEGRSRAKAKAKARARVRPL